MKLKVAIPPLEVKFKAELVLEVTSVPTISREQGWADLEGSEDSNDSFLQEGPMQSASVLAEYKNLLWSYRKHIMW